MFGANDLKANITITETTVECPVKGCSEIVTRQRRSLKREPQFQCPTHRIYISPSTFEYPSQTDNLLWRGSEDLSLLRAVKTVKRESRIARDNSEDAVTWNVFRYLEKNGLVSASLSFLIGVPVTNSQPVYWSYSQATQGVWPELARARAEFGEQPRRSSEPDLIVASDEALFLIEAKFTATNRTTPSHPQDTKKYLTGGNNWYRRVFKSDYATLAIQEQKYELTRFWLLGSWMAAQLDRDFYLINLVLKEREKDIERLFKPHLRTGTRCHFLRQSWADIYRWVSENAPMTQDRELFTSYFENKTLGYDRFGGLQLAFQGDQGLTVGRHKEIART